ncbi:hypothetical protein [Agathobacter sp.]
MNEMEYLGFKEKLRGILVKIVIGLVVGVAVAIGLDMATVGSMYISHMILMAIMCAGIPYAWSVLPIRLGGFIGIIVMFFICMFLGWIITPIALIYNVIQMKRYEKKCNPEQ